MGTEGDDFRVIAGRYRLEARLGRGGMGIVWRATDQLLERRVAVKELPLDETLSAEEAALQRERTLREARAVARLRHPHLVVVYDVVVQDERPYIVMELIDGGSLADRIAARGPVDAAEGARIGVALLSALRTAHAAGVLHRDIKPANVLVESGTDRIVLTDFGIARMAGATTLTETGSFVGSPEYTAPERMSGAGTGPESDLWSLGALLCTALSGESPFRRDSLGGILHAVVFDEIRPPAQAAPILPVVRGLLERDPDRRLTAAEAERMLRAFLESGRTPGMPVRITPTQRGVPVTSDAPGPAPTGPASRAPARYPTRNVLVAALLVAATAGAGASAVALLMRGGGSDGGKPASSGPHMPADATHATDGTASRPNTPSPPPGSPRGSLPVPVSTATVTPAAEGAVPSGHHLVHDPAGFSVPVPDGFTREPQGERVFYVSPGETFRLGIKVARPESGGPLAVMRRADAAGPDTNPGYRDGRVTATTHRGHPAALWEFTWNGFSAAEGPRHSYDLCWEQDGRMYDVWVSAPAGRVREAKEHFDAAVGGFDAQVTGR
ncbi:serine/threonine-protein kinase [Streptomyces sp. NPDC017179]|uniref:serine/threonine-protein kinase n=1 Tax=Streptomyces sp. NPDC017179 TaxID=3364979 RepID=UPI00378B4D8C